MTDYKPNFGDYAFPQPWSKIEYMLNEFRREIILGGVSKWGDLRDIDDLEECLRYVAMGYFLKTISDKLKNYIERMDDLLSNPATHWMHRYCSYVVCVIRDANLPDGTKPNREIKFEKART